MSEAKKRLRGLPKLCECGGQMRYQFTHGRVWGVCERCTPVVEMHEQVMRRLSISAEHLSGHINTMPDAGNIREAIAHISELERQNEELRGQLAEAKEREIVRTRQRDAAEARADEAERNARRNWERAGQYWDLVLAKDRQLDRHREVLGELVQHWSPLSESPRSKAAADAARDLLSTEPASAPTEGRCENCAHPAHSGECSRLLVRSGIVVPCACRQPGEPSSDGVQAASEPDWLRDVFSRFVLPGLQTDCGRVWYPNVWQSVDEAYRDWLHNVPTAFKLVAAGIDKGPPSGERAAPGKPSTESEGEG